MLKSVFPTGTPFRRVSPASIDSPGFYYVTVLSKNFFIPILPYRDSESGKLLFPNGKFSGLY
jgi:hypothetical protein